MSRKQGGPPSGERTGEPSFISQTREALEALRQMYKTMGQEPDYSSVWESDDFKALSPDQQDALKREFGAPVEARFSAEEQPAVDEVRGELNARKSMFDAVQTPPDYSDTWNSDHFKALSPEAQQKLRAEFPDAAAPAAPARRAKAADQQRPPRTEARADAAEARESRKEPPKKRAFESYSFAKDEESGRFGLVENYKEWDPNAGEYREKKLRTNISVPRKLNEAMQNDPEVAARISDFCEKLRRELDKRGVKIYFDKPKDEPERIQPKWKYYVDGKMIEEQLKAEDLPPEIVELVKSDDRYFQTPQWKKWFGRMMQAKREAIISSELANRPDVKDRAPADEAVPVTEDMVEKDEPAAGEAEAMDIIEGEKTAVREKARSRSEARKFAYDMIVMLSELYPLPEKMNTFLDHLERFADSFLDLQYKQRTGMPSSARLSKEELRTILHEAVRERFEAEPEVVAALEATAPVEKIAEEPPPREESKEVNVQAEMEEPSPEYAALRQEARRIKSEKDLDGFLAELRKKSKDADPAVREAASTLLVEIDHGQVGPVSETRLAGLERTAEEKAFFKEHPLLDRRNVELTSDGRAVIYLDRVQANEALSRAVKLLVQDTLEGQEKGLDQDALVQEISVHIFKILGRRRADQEVAKRFKDSVAELNFSNGELVIKDSDKLFGIIKKLAEHVRQRQKEG